MRPHPSGKVTQIRRFTNNIVYRYRGEEGDVFCKLVHDPADARAEEDGYDAISQFYRVPARRSVSVDGRGRTLVCYEYVPTVGQNSGLLADLIAQSGDASMAPLEAYAEELTSAYRRVILSTGRKLPKQRVRTKLFEDRVKPLGRIDEYYGEAVACSIPTGGEVVDVKDSHGIALAINGVSHTFHWQRVLHDLRQYFLGTEECTAAVTQGDPTELNLGVPLMWFDFDNAGYNSVLGEWANFLWYVYILGGYAVPKYAPRLFRDHPCVLPLVQSRAPRLKTGRHGGAIFIDYAVDVGHPRRVLLSRYLKLLIEPVSKVFDMEQWESDIRYYLALRIIGVYDIFKFQPQDSWFMLAKLAECMNGERFQLGPFLGME